MIIEESSTKNTPRPPGLDDARALKPSMAVIKSHTCRQQAHWHHLHGAVVMACKQKAARAGADAAGEAALVDEGLRDVDAVDGLDEADPDVSRGREY